MTNIDRDMSILKIDIILFTSYSILTQILLMIYASHNTHRFRSKESMIKF